MFKNLVAPIQTWLLSQGRCVGCSMSLDQAEVKGDLVFCKCGRIFKKEEQGKYRRAKIDEVKK